MATTAPEPYIAQRLEKLRAAMTEKKLDALLVTNHADVSYLTGFEGEDSFAIVTAETAVLISDSRYEEQIAREAPWLPHVIRRKGMWEAVGARLRKLKPDRLGVQSESMTLRGLANLKEHGVKDRRPRLVPVAEMVIALRHIKDAREIDILERAVAIAEHGFEMLKAHMRIGMTENHIASRLTHEMRKLGALNASFDTIVAVGANGSLPHYRPGAEKARNNSSLLIDWGAKAAGYCSDLTRMVFFGAIDPRMKEIYQIVLQAQQAAIAAIAPGKKAVHVDGVARKIITAAGYGKNFGHGLGHGIGRDIHEAIALSKQSKVVLEPGMVVTVEPGIYLPGVGGVRIEDDVLVTADGYRVLSHLPKDLDSARL